MLNDSLLQPDRQIGKQQRQNVDVLLLVVSGSMVFASSVDAAPCTLSVGQWAQLTAGKGGFTFLLGGQLMTLIAVVELGVLWETPQTRTPIHMYAHKHTQSLTGALYSVRNPSSDTPLRFLELAVMAPRLGAEPRSFNSAHEPFVAVEGWAHAPIQLEADAKLRMARSAPIFHEIMSSISINLSIYLSIDLSISHLYQSITSIHPSTHLSIYLSIYLSISLSMSLSVYVSIYPPIYLSVCVLSTLYFFSLSSDLLFLSSPSVNLLNCEALKALCRWGPGRAA